MATLLEFREKLIGLFRRYETVATIAAKFLVTFAAVMIINGKIGYNETITGGLFSLIIGLIGAIAPAYLTIVVLSGVIVAQLYDLSLIAALVGLALMLLLMLIYLRFSPGNIWLLLLSPVLFALRIPYLLPLAGGLLFGPLTVVPVTFAVVYAYFIRFISDNERVLGGVEGEEQEALTQVQTILDGLLKNREMLVMIIAFAIVLLVVYVLRRRLLNDSWTIAIAAGAVLELVVLIAGDIAMNANLSIVGILLGTLVSAAIAFGLKILLWNLDYEAIEDVQFEDDDYYYYVKAVPKLSYTPSNPTMRRISVSKRKDPPPPDAEGFREENYGEEYFPEGEDYLEEDEY